MNHRSLSDGGTPTIDSEALGSWVAETAAEKGISEQELLDEILSSYWVLEELSDVIVDPDTDAPPADGDDPEGGDPGDEPRTAASDEPGSWEAQSGEGDADDDGLALSGIEQELEKLRTVINELSDEQSLPSPSDDQPTRSGQQGSQQHQQSRSQQPNGQAQQSNAQPHQQSTSQPHQQSTSQPHQQSTSQPHQQPNSQHQQHTQQQPNTQPQQQPNAQSQQQPTNQPQQQPNGPPQGSNPGSQPVDDGFDEFTSATADSRDDTAGIADASGVIDEFDAELDEIRRRVAELETTVSEGVGADTDLDELEAWIQNEFDNIEDVLEHLLSKTDNLEYRIGSAVDSQREQLEPLQDAHAEREQLTSLKNEAIQKDVDTAACSDCGESVDLGVLPSPYCPNCEQQFTGVEAGQRWNPFSSPSLRTAPSRPGGSASTQPASASRASGHSDQPQPSSESRQSTEGRQSTESHGQQSEQPPTPGQQSGDDHQPRTDGGFEWVDGQ